jgi:hypothetical protein
MPPMTQASAAARNEAEQRNKENGTVPPQKNYDRLALAGKLAGRYPADKADLAKGHHRGRMQVLPRQPARSPAMMSTNS